MSGELGGVVRDEVYADVLVAGAGAAGLSAALGCVPRQVVVLTKARLSAAGAGGASVWAQGGVASAVGEDDDPALHAADTLAAGAGLNDDGIVRLLTREGPDRIRALLALGARFDRDGFGRLALGREAAHSRRRILHAHGDATGAEVMRTLVEAVRREPAIRVVDQAFALDLVLAGGAVVGLEALHRDGRRVLYRAPAVVLATGGLGQLFLYTTNPREATADGLAMAARAGARLVDLEFVQFHPTALAVGGAARRAGPEAAGGAPLPLLTEALRGEGAVLVDDHGVRFMAEVHPDRELAPRDVVARAIWDRLQQGRQVFLDARGAVGDRFPERFPTVFELCRRHGIDPRVEPMPVVPAAHYHMGGIAVDASGRTSLPGLWACGEVAATGAHGANRLASNSLLEALVFGARVATDVIGVAGPRPAPALTAAGRALHELPPGAEPARISHTPTSRGAANRPGSKAREGSTTEAYSKYVEGGDPSATQETGRFPAPQQEAREKCGPESGDAVAELAARLRRILWEAVGVERDGSSLAAACAELAMLARRHADALADPRLPAAQAEAAGEVRNMLLVGRLLAAAALARRESRGGHFRADHPYADIAWQRRLFLTAAADGSACFESSDPTPVPAVRPLDSQAAQAGEAPRITAGLDLPEPVPVALGRPRG